MKSARYQTTKGGPELAAAFANLAKDMRERTLERGMRGLVAPIVVAAKRFARRSRDTGALEASITDKIKVYPGTNTVVGLVGPDRDYYSRGRKVKGRLSRALAKNQRKPANYAHLVEYGHVAAAGGALRHQYNHELVKTGKGNLRRWKKTTIKEVAKGRAVGFVPPKPFIRPAVLTTSAQQSEGFYRGIERGFSAAVRREERAGRHVRSSK